MKWRTDFENIPKGEFIVSYCGKSYLAYKKTTKAKKISILSNTTQEYNYLISEIDGWMFMPEGINMKIAVIKEQQVICNRVDSIHCNKTRKNFRCEHDVLHNKNEDCIENDICINGEGSEIAVKCLKIGKQ